LPASLPGRLTFTTITPIITLPKVDVLLEGKVDVLLEGQSGKSGDESVGLNMSRPQQPS
jgi:hypothetical protein